MEYIQVEKSGALVGNVKIDGSKNAALPIIAATLLAYEPVVLKNIPNLKDVEVILEVLKSLGTKVRYLEDNVVEIDASNIKSLEPNPELMSKMRASFLVSGPLITRFGYTKVEMPGGCNIGKRPVDMHLKGFKQLGAEVIEDTYSVTIKVPESGLKGNNIYLDFPSVGATQNIMMAAASAIGTTIIENAAKEPEIVDLANFINKIGGKVKGAGTSTITIVGNKQIGHSASHKIIPDRIEAATFLVAAAITGGNLRVENVIASHIRPIIAKLTEMGCEINEESDLDYIDIRADKPLISTNIKTLPYPGFPTDAQAQFMALMTICSGKSKVKETVFENRFMHVEELAKMGAIIVTDGDSAVVAGTNNLKGAKVKATDLRAGAALVLAGLVADGITEVHNLYHIDRGYVNFETKLEKLGAKIKRIKK